MQAPDDEWDAKLEAALRGYADPGREPDPTVLVARVFAAVEERRAPGWMWTGWRLGAAFACLVAVVMAVSYVRLRSPRSSVHQETLRSAPRQELRPLSSVASRAVPAHALGEVPALRPHVARVEVRKPPKLEQFPQPQPLSEQEKLMLAFVSAASPADKRVVAKAAEPLDSMRVADVELPVTQPYKLKTETIGALHEEDR